MQPSLPGILHKQRGAMDEWLKWLSYGAKVAVKRKFEAVLGHVMTGKLSLSNQQ